MLKSKGILMAHQWDYLAEGQTNFVLSYNGLSDIYRGKVLRIKKQKIKKDIQMALDKQLSDIFASFLQRVKLFSQYLITSQELEIEAQLKVEFLEQIWHKLRAKSKSKNQAKGLSYKDPIELMPNLLDIEDNEHTCCIQIKPKSPVFDRYRPNTLQKVGSKFGLTAKQLVTEIQSLPERMNIQKNKRQLINNKPHSNLISSIDFFKGSTINYMKQNKQMIQKCFYNKNQIPFSDFPVAAGELSLLINRVLHKQDIFNKLLSVIHLYTKSFQRLNSYSYQSLASTLESADWTAVTDELVSRTIHNLDSKKFKQDNNVVDEDPLPCSRYQQLMQTLSYLLSGTFRDISIFIRITLMDTPSDMKVNQKYWCDYEVRILDYQLKSIYRTKGKYVQEDQENLVKLVPMILSQKLSLPTKPREEL